MKRKFNKLVHGLASFAIALSPTGYVSADDTEIFFGNPAGNGLIPNILFVLDNSGSMDTLVTTQSEYDSNQTYTGSKDDNYIYVYDGNSYWGKFKKENNRCQQMTESLARDGQYSSARVAAYTNERWRGRDYWAWRSILRRSETDDTSLIECQDDRDSTPAHGETAASSDIYARKDYNKSTKWTSNSSQELSWGSINQYDYYSANYHNWYDNHRSSTSRMRIDIMKDVVRSLVNSTSGINIGLMSFNTNNGGKQGGRVTVPIDYIEDNRSAFINDVNGINGLNNLNPDTWTPLSETLFEAMRYYEGGSVYLGSQSVAGSKDPSNALKYKSPIISECQANNIVLLTDGEPTFDAEITNYHDWYGDNQDETNDNASRAVIESKVGSCSGNCLDEVSKYMYDHDLLPSTLTDIQNVKTYTIGFNIDHPLLKAAAEGTGAGTSNVGGGGLYFTADDTEELENALKDIVDDIKSTNTTFVSPGVAVNTFNRLNHRDELYFSVFKPELRPEWAGNLKRYRLGTDGVIYDKNNNDAVDPTTGFFKSGSNGAQSFWSPSIDGDEVQLGGAAANLPSDNSKRNVYTFITAGPTDLTDGDNAVSVANKTIISKDKLGVSTASDADHEKLINWIRGADSKDSDGDGDTAEGRQVIMDPLHSPPVVVIYGGTNTAPDTTIFFGDNQGFLHAVNGKSGTSSTYGQSEGEEYFAFIPEDLLANQKDIYENSQSSDHPYGLDGAITTWTHDDNGDNQISGNDDFVYIYTGMRRGGKNYYALDVTSRTSPKMLWQIKGGTGGSTGFEELGQTWSRPVKTKIEVGNTTKEVLIFAGGYDETQDGVSVRTTDSIGRAIYIVDAETGGLIWSGGPNNTDFTTAFAKMQYSIPSAIKVIDVNGDLLADQMYVGDMGGQVWRFDINNGSSARSLVEGAVIADLAGSTAADNRRFYHEPDVSVYKDGNTRVLALAIGSGWQAHPLDDVVEDRFYLIKDSDLLAKPEDADGDGSPDYLSLTESSLYDATDNHLGHVSAVNTLAQQTQAFSDLAAADGWYIKLTRAGEKVLATSLTVGGDLYFTTYEPTPNANGCNISAGTPRLFHIKLGDATPRQNYDGIGSVNELTRPDREVKLMTTSLPTAPQRLRVEGNDHLCIGTECSPMDSGESILKTYWVEEN